MATQTRNSRNYSLKEIVAPLDWAEVGISKPEIDATTKTRFQAWLRENKGPQMQYLERRQEERLNPKAYFPQAQSILCFAEYYFPGWAKGEVKVSNYSWGVDYHHQLKEKLEKTLNLLKNKLGEFSSRICVDTAPILEKYFAVQAGIGWQGKNTLLLNRKHGSLLFLGEIFTDLDPKLFLEFGHKESDHCGNCTRCIEACPTDALAPYQLFADKCISYWTLEHKGDFTDDTPEWDEWIAGCDICQEVCPWNKRLIPLDQTEFDADFEKLSAADIHDPAWQKRIQEKAISYVKPENWPRNLQKMGLSPNSDKKG